MTLLTIPPRAKAGFLTLAKLSDDAFNSLVQQLEHGRNLAIREVAADIAQAISLPEVEAQEISLALIALQSDDIPRQTIVSDLVETLTSQGDLDKQRAESLSRRLDVAVKLAPFASFTQVARLLVRNERNFISCRAVTDLRPAFGENVSRGPMAFTMLHDLEIGFKEEGNTKHFYVALDERDVDELIETLQRSKQKVEALKQYLEKVRMPYLTTNRET